MLEALIKVLIWKIEAKVFLVKLDVKLGIQYFSLLSTSQLLFQRKP